MTKKSRNKVWFVHAWFVDGDVPDDGPYTWEQCVRVFRETQTQENVTRVRYTWDWDPLDHLVDVEL